MKRIFLTLVLLLVPATSSALQPETTNLVSDTTLSVPSTFSQEDLTAYVGIDECERMIENSSLVGVTFATLRDTTLNAGLFDRAVYFDVARESSARIDCETSELCREVAVDDVEETSETIEVEAEFGEIADLESAAACANLDREFFVRVELRQNANDEEKENSDARIIVDTVRPTAPTLNDVVVTESLIRAEFTPSDDTDLLRYRMVWSTDPLTEGTLPDDISGSGKTFGNDSVSSGEVSVTLNPGDMVYVGISSQDQAGNLSPLSSVIQVEVIETTDFWEAYKEAGGQAEGCSSSGSAPTAPLGVILLGLFLAVRRNRERSNS